MVNHNDDGDALRISAQRVPDAVIEQVISASTERSSNRGTRQVYRNAMESFARSVGKSPHEAARLLFSSDAETGAAIAQRYRESLLNTGFTPATVNLYLGRLRNFVAEARIAGLISWSLDVELVRDHSRSGQNVISRGDYADAVGAILGNSTKAIRDRAMLAIIYELALRRNELSMLDLCHLDIKHGTISVSGRDRGERITHRISQDTTRLIQLWIESRGTTEGPLFVNLHAAGSRSRITNKSIYTIVKAHLDCAGGAVGPSGLRQSGMANMIESFGIDLASARLLSLERCPKVTLHPEAPTNSNTPPAP